LAVCRNFPKSTGFIARFSVRFSMDIREGSARTGRLLRHGVVGVCMRCPADWRTKSLTQRTSTHFLHFPDFPHGNQIKISEPICYQQLKFEMPRATTSKNQKREALHSRSVVGICTEQMTNEPMIKQPQ